MVAREFEKIRSEFQTPDLIIAAMPTYDLAESAVSYAKANNIISIVDVRDMWPDIFLDHAPLFFRRFLKLILWKDYKMLKDCLNKSTAITSMSDEILDWSFNYRGIKKTWSDKVFYLGADPLLEPNLNNEPDYLSGLENKFIVSFVGTFGKYYNPSIIAEVAKEFSSNNDIIFVLAGSGMFFNDVSSLTSGLKNVILPGWVNNYEISAILRRSSVGIIPASIKTDAFPNKAFTYFSAGIPIISSCDGELKTMLKKTGFGYSFSPGNAKELYDAINKVYQDRAAYQLKKEKILNLFEKKYNTQVIYKDYVKHVQKIQSFYG